ncbi:MAG: glycoside hydrolase family 43 protein [Luteolibacter sp.]|uniref:glycoside hydrolase family 43 protein n=1 Tax=Luteolibacter sp. TaxID=1962973 RepID=UPI00326545D1
MNLPRALATIALLATSVLADEPTPVAFDCFEYTGSDIQPSEKLPPGHYRNPILTGFFPDPSVCRVGQDFYLVNSTFSYFPGLPVFKSRDLVNWTLAGNAISRPTQLDYHGSGISRGLFAPDIQWHDGIFYIVCTMIDRKGNFVITAIDPAGPWSDPVWLDFPGIDPSLFFDDDGRVWLVHNGEPPDNKPLYQGHRAVWLRQLDPQVKKLIGEPVLLVNGGVDITKKPVWIEGPHLLKRDGWYYLTCAEGGTGPQHSQVILRSRAITGPFDPWNGNPILTQRDLDDTVPGAVTCTGHADLIEAPDGKWWSVFLGCRPFPDGGLYTAGRETFLLPVTWTDDGWPVILAAGKRVPLVAPGPSVTAPTASTAALNGDFTWSENFDSPALDGLWLMIRQPTAGSLWKVDSGKLLLTPGSETLAGDQHPAFLSRRVQHGRFRVSTTLETPTAPGIDAGLALFQTEKNYYFLGARRNGSAVEIFVELADSGAPAVIHHVNVQPNEKISLRIAADLNAVSFEWSTDGKSWDTFSAPAGIRPVSVQAAGGGMHFTGAVVGMHARRIL